MSARKVSQAQAGYVEPSPVLGQTCGNCDAFEPVEYAQAPPPGRWAGGCRRIEGGVNSGGWCLLWAFRLGDPFP